MDLFSSVFLPFIITIFKYLFMCIGAFSHLSNDSLIFISTNIQTENIPQITLWDNFIKNLGNMFYTPPIKHSKYIEKNNTRFLVEKNTSKIEKEVSTWLSQNTFMINMGCVLSLIAGLTLIYFCFTFCKKEKTGISYHNYFIRIMMLSYYSLTNMAMIYLITSGGSPPFYMLSVAILFFNSVCLPLYCFSILRKNRNKMADAIVKENYGCIYLPYKRQCYYFSLVIMLKQFLYSVVFIISHFTALHKIICLAIQGGVNLCFLLLVIFYKPFTKRIYLYQAVIISVIKIITVIISSIMFAMTLNLNYVLNGLYISIILSNVLIYGLPLLPWYKKKMKEYTEKQQTQSIDAYVDNTGVQEWVVREYLKEDEKE